MHLRAQSLTRKRASSYLSHSKLLESWVPDKIVAHLTIQATAPRVNVCARVSKGGSRKQQHKATNRNDAVSWFRVSIDLPQTRSLDIVDRGSSR